MSGTIRMFHNAPVISMVCAVGSKLRRISIRFEKHRSKVLMVHGAYKTQSDTVGHSARAEIPTGTQDSFRTSRALPSFFHMIHVSVVSLYNRKCPAQDWILLALCHLSQKSMKIIMHHYMNLSGTLLTKDLFLG